MSEAVSRSFVITIDGAAGAGKSSTAREVARRLGFRHLDSGALYRGVTFALLSDGGVKGPRASSPSVKGGVQDASGAFEGARWGGLTRDRIDQLGIHVHWAAGGMEVWTSKGSVPDEALRTEAVTRAVSAVSALSPVRSWLLEVQRDAALGAGLVADGRDMGTVVFPEADLKVFLKADEGVRARRRLMQQGIVDPTPNQVRIEERRIAARDEKDSNRAISPLRIPKGALIIDTTALDFEEQVGEIVARVGVANRPGSRSER